MNAYPPEPWSLVGQLHASAFLVPAAALPHDLPPGVRVVTVGGRGLVVAAWVRYEPGGVLQYHEVLTTVLARHGARLLPTITHIWVDSETSLRGGRELWGIPKGLASFRMTGREFAAADIASATLARLARLPFRLPFRFSVVQEMAGAALRTPVRGTARFGLSRIAWRCDPDGRLGFLAGRRPVLSFSVADFRMRFGQAARTA